MKFLKNTEFPEYPCRIIQNSNNEIELITRNYFGKKASLEYEQNRILRKIRKKLGEEIRKSDEELIGRNYEERDLEFQEDIIEFPEAEFVKD
jgi:hypothetical protein